MTKADSIRNAHAKQPQLGPTELAKQLTAKGVKVSPAHVSAVLGEARAKRKPKSSSNGNGLIGQLRAASALVKATGSVKEAKAMLEALESLL
jgi:hypothetical protein